VLGLLKELEVLNLVGTRNIANTVRAGLP